MKNNTAILILFTLLLFSCKCNKEASISIKLPETKKPIDFIRWGVVKYDLSRLRNEPFFNADVIDYVKLGKVIKVLLKDYELKNFDNEIDYWYFIDYDGERAWIFGSFIDIYNTYDEAAKKSEEIFLNK